MKYNPLIHHRRSIRLKGYDYSQAGMYFITLCCRNRQSLFGEVINGEMVLSDAGKIADTEWKNTLKLRSNVDLDEFVIMPNHMHGIIVINDDVVVDRAVLHTALYDNQIRNIPGDEDTKGINKKPLQSPSQTVGAIIRGYKSAVTRQINILPYNNKEEYYKKGITDNLSEGITDNLSEGITDNLSEGVFNNPSEGVFNTPQRPPIKRIVWQTNYYEIIIRDDIAYQNISNYIRNNPSKWNGDKFFYNHLNK